ncbi:MAG: GAF domain-containing protein [Planctomycetota bacterium]
MVAKEEAYAAIRARLEALLVDASDFVAVMATTAAVLKEHLEHASWVGFYLPEPDGALRVGPYQGPPASVRLPPGGGVCGAVARSRRSLVVPDVHAFEGHIACDPRSRSEIVVPVLKGERLSAVLDLDSERPAAFDEIDRRGLEAVAGLLTR